MRETLETLADLLDSYGWVRRGLLVFAGLCVITSALIGLVDDPEPWIVNVRGAALVLAAVIPVLLAVTERTAGALTRKLAQTVERCEQAVIAKEKSDRMQNALEHILRQRIVLYETFRAIDETTDAVLLADRGLRAGMRKGQVCSILDLLIEQKATLFGINDERWTFAVYVPDGDRLTMLATRRWSRASETAEHRAWRPGEGHVGQAFSHRKELVCHDSNDPSVRELIVAKGKNYREEDESLYVSFASVPIMIGARDDPLGVLVATSDKAGRFGPSTEDSDKMGRTDPTEPLRVAANTIATILCMTHDSSNHYGTDEEEQDVDDQA